MDTFVIVLLSGVVGEFVPQSFYSTLNEIFVGLFQSKRQRKREVRGEMCYVLYAGFFVEFAT